LLTHGGRQLDDDDEGDSGDSTSSHDGGVDRRGGGATRDCLQHRTQGAPGVTFLDETYSSKDIAIALHRWYDADRAKLVRVAGRECDIWGWYLSDFEMALDMSLFMRRLDKYFSALPARASKDIRAISTEICFHGWPQIINAYVSAQKMWNPYRKLDEIEREFCAGMFGDSNADAVLKVYRACEAYVHPEYYYGFIPPTDCLPVVFGTPNYNRQCREALVAGAKVKLDAKHQPRLTSATSPEALWRFLLDDLKMIAIFSEAREKINSAMAAGADAAVLDAIWSEAKKAAASYVNYPDYELLSRR